jgi:hypothetical protein
MRWQTAWQRADLREAAVTLAIVSMAVLGSLQYQW